MVRFHRPMAGFTAHGHLGHAGMVAVASAVVVFAHAGVMAARAHLIPHHAASGPVAPFARLAVFVAIDVEPVASFRIKAGLHRVQRAARAFHQELP